MYILALETSTLVASVALAENNRIVVEYTLHYLKEHSVKLMPMIAQVMSDIGARPQDISAVAVSYGPGSFTGLRIGMTTAKLLASVWKVPLVCVPTLDALAENIAGSDGVVCPMLWAERKQAYTAFYRAGKRIGDFLVAGPAELAGMWRSISNNREIITFCGEIERFPELRQLFPNNRFAPVHQCMPRAGSVALIGQQKLAAGDVSDPGKAAPLYIRKSEAEVRLEEKMSQCGEGAASCE